MSALPELPEQQILHTQTPDSHWYGYVSGYTKNQMREYGDARAAHARKAALEEAAKALDSLIQKAHFDQEAIAIALAQAIIKGIK